MKLTAQADDTNILQAVVDVIGFILFAFAQIARCIYGVILPQSYRYMKDVRGEIVLVTGGGGGLGRLLALRLAKLGATIVLWDVNPQGEYPQVRLSSESILISLNSVLAIKHL